MNEVAPGWQAVRGVGGGPGTHCQGLVRACPVKRALGLEHLGLRVRLHTMADGGGRVVHPCPSTHSEGRCRTQCVREGGGSAVNTRNGEGVVCANNVVLELLLVGGQVTIGQVVAGQTPVPHDAGAVQTRQGEAWESAHVDLVRHQACRRAGGIVVREFDVGQMQVPIAMWLVRKHS